MEEYKNLQGILKYYYSGGFDNQDPLLSIGGEISNSIININEENIFNNISQDLYKKGLIDYRCLYLRNISNKRIHKLSLFLDDFFKGATFNLGFNLKNEIQTITISGGNFINNQYIIFSYDEHKFKVKYNRNINIFKSNFQTSIRKIYTLKDVIVEGVHAGGNNVLNIKFVHGVLSFCYEFVLNEDYLKFYNINGDNVDVFGYDYFDLVNCLNNNNKSSLKKYLYFTYNFLPESLVNDIETYIKH